MKCYVHSAAGAAMAAAVLFATGSSAETMQVNATVSYMPLYHCDKCTSDLAGKTKASRDLFQGTIHDATPGSRIDGSTQYCFGVTLTADGKPDLLGGGGYCDAVDKDGDIWWLSWSISAAQSTWTAMGGTGKYAGLTGNGTTTVLPAGPAVTVGFSQTVEGVLNFAAAK